MLDIELQGESPIIEQRSEEWFNQRLGKITGSKFCSIMPSEKARVEWTETQYDVLLTVALERLTGIREEGFKSRAMQDGTDREPECKAFFESKYWEVVEDCPFIPFGDFGASPDGVIGGHTAYESKCPKDNTHLKYLLNPQRLFEQYKWQVVGECIALGVNKAVIVSYNPNFKDKFKMCRYDYELDQADVEKLIARLESAELKIQEIISNLEAMYGDDNA